MSRAKRIRVFAGSASQTLAQHICRVLEASGDLKEQAVPAIDRFSDGEVRIKDIPDIRGEDVFIVNATHPPADNLLEVYLLADACRKASAWRVTLVLPYLGYNRQDRRIGREPVSAARIIKMLQHSGCDRILFFDVHAEATLGACDLEHDHIYGSPSMVPYLRRNILPRGECVIASPDKGGLPRAIAYSRFLDQQEPAIFYKQRDADGDAETVGIVGDVAGKQVILVDDIIDTAGTVVSAAREAKRYGATAVYVCATHALFSPPAVERIAGSELDEVIVTDTIEHGEASFPSNIVFTSVAEQFARAIKLIHAGESLEPVRSC